MNYGARQSTESTRKLDALAGNNEAYDPGTYFAY